MPAAARTTITIWHNPRCSKSRETLALLQEHGVEPAIREYLKQPPSRREVETLLDLLDGEPRALLRDGEAEFKATGKKAATLTRKDVVELIAAHPVLLQRPVVVAADKAAIGRPPEAVLKVIGKM
ncbi:arsenate reductase (glutaredoxin) [Vineibacter terrae]|uniref:arsenate reductase (glutaredoxin) n=1 Tax=Vineibacter terrae TaxID=2586908 RepID=UPI002E330843|nr:arsenate reductase (glutaredoxin) [Vineibacter terrae]HEX2890159.1 arsenate reductase (glutaredoxin) [Vineibacter terrae]